MVYINAREHNHAFHLCQQHADELSGDSEHLAFTEKELLSYCASQHAINEPVPDNVYDTFISILARFK